MFVTCQLSDGSLRPQSILTAKSGPAESGAAESGAAESGAAALLQVLRRKIFAIKPGNLIGIIFAIKRFL